MDKEKALSIIKEIKNNCSIVLESWRVKDNQHIVTRQGLENILTLCKLLVDEIEGSPGKPGGTGEGGKDHEDNRRGQ